jgi:uncharacterized protein (TIGR00725 family)
MTLEPYDIEAEGLSRQLPNGPRVAVIGSQSFGGDDSEEISSVIGTDLGASADVVLLTGGVCGVGEAVGRSSFRAREGLSLPPNTYHVLPHDDDRWDYGITLFASNTMHDRREILARVASVYLCIEGGPATAHEAKVAQRVGAHVVPIGRTGGVAENLYTEILCPDGTIEQDWRMLGDYACSVVGVADAA